MSNFKFLQNHYQGLYQKMIKAESRVNTEPKSAAHYCRLALEEVVNLIYKEEYLEMPYDTRLANLMREFEFKNIVPSKTYQGIFYYTRKIGNDGAHFGKQVTSKDALISIRYLYDFLKWFTNIYADTSPDLPDAFDQSLIPKVGAAAQAKRTQKAIVEEAQKENKTLQAQIEALQQQLEIKVSIAQSTEEAFEAYKEEQAAAKAKLEAQKATREASLPSKPTSEFNEAETRKHLIDMALREAGWANLQKDRGIEFKVEGMPITPDNPHGNGYVDYVLWDDNGLPLAVIEAKRTSSDPKVGKHQAKLYADCLEKKFKQRPLIFYTNGYETYIWDDTFYSMDRRVYGFYTKEELQWFIQRRSTLKDIRQPEINQEITNRPYQREAIVRLAESMVVNETGSKRLRGNKRSGLLVMATGSGKTRTAASIVDILFKNNWVKRVLFLADRNALVKQAKDAFGEHLPELSSVNLTKDKENNTTRLVFSTYQSIINKIDSVRNEDERFYGVGHFDLIVIDEAHRSVYNKYGVIFEYFDSLLLGLTATPKREIDFNTYELFDCVEGDPTYFYELEDAVQNGYLVPYNTIKFTTGFLSDGVTYSKLSETDKKKYEDSFRDDATGLFPEQVAKSAMNKWFFNIDTVNKVLDVLMESGLKIEGGDKIGRTIIFAANQQHAKLIVECFEKRYPQHPAGFIAMIHNKVSHAQSLIDDFCDHYNENNPQIAVSVDMMDTGIDAPRTLNLVFFKVVRSYSKFWQMIGRGTRLCPDVFDVNEPKKNFLIFDACENFAFFEENERGKAAKKIQSLTQQIFNTRLAVARLLMETGEEEDRGLSSQIVDTLHKAIETLDTSRFDVNMKLEYVDDFKKRERWTRLDPESIHVIEEHLSGLPAPESVNEIVRRFDLMMLKMMQSQLLINGRFPKYRDNLIGIADELSKKYAIPEVEIQKKTIEAIKDNRFYDQITNKKIDEIREDIRHLMKYLGKAERPHVVIDIEDTEPTLVIEPSGVYQVTEEVYKKRVESFVRENKLEIAINKIRKKLKITPAELKVLEGILFDGAERGTKDKFKEVYGDEPLVKFIRSIIGLDVSVANEAFGDFLEEGQLNADQMKFIQTIINYLNINGTIDKNLLDQPPFDDAHEEGIYGLFDDHQTVKIVSLIDRINGSAEVG